MCLCVEGLEGEGEKQTANTKLDLNYQKGVVYVNFGNQ